MINQVGAIKKSVLILIGVMILLAAGGVLYYVWHTNHSSTKTTAVAVVSKNSDAVPTAKTTDKTPAVELKEYCASDEKACFSYPNTWTLATENEYIDTELHNSAVSVTSPNGTKLLYHSGVGGLGGNCDPTPDTVITYDTVATSTGIASVRVVEAHIGTGTSPTDIGLSSNSSIKIGKTNECLLYFVFNSKNNPDYGVAFGTMNHTYNPKDSVEAKAILNSYHYTD
jgi:hypothetical protein